MSDGKARRLASMLIGLLDCTLRRRLGIRQYSDRDDCLFRIRIIRSTENVALADGTRVHCGDPLVELHFWNEHAPAFAGSQPDLRWARVLYQRAVHSLEDLAACLEKEPSMARVQAILGTRPVADAADRMRWSGPLQRLGFEIIDLPQPDFWQRWHRRGEDLLVWALIWSVNPESLRGKGLIRGRLRCWMSRGALLERYARGAPSASGAGSA